MNISSLSEEFFHTCSSMNGHNLLNVWCDKNFFTASVLPLIRRWLHISWRKKNITHIRILQVVPLIRKRACTLLSAEDLTRQELLLIVSLHIYFATFSRWWGNINFQSQRNSLYINSMVYFAAGCPPTQVVAVTDQRRLFQNVLAYWVACIIPLHIEMLFP
jgi:hypothetical protein